MKSLGYGVLAWSAFILSAGSPANAQTEIIQAIGGAIQSASIMTARAEWSQIPAEQLSCIERELQEEKLSIAGLVRQAIYPSDKRLSGLRDYCAKGPERSDYEKRTKETAQVQSGGGAAGRQQSRPQLGQSPRDASDSSDPISLGTAEQRFGAFIKRSWIVNNAQNLGCDGRSYEQSDVCLSQKGYSLTQEYPRTCTMVSKESHPIPQNAHRKWDGSIDQSVEHLLQRQLELGLGALSESRIKSTPSFEFFFKVSPDDPVRIKARMSSSPQAWAEIPNPPNIVGLQMKYPNAADRALRHQTMLSEWSRSNARFRSNQALPAFEFATGPDENFIKLTTSPMQILFGYDRSALMHQIFIGVIKDLLAKCGSSNERR